MSPPPSPGGDHSHNGPLPSTKTRKLPIRRKIQKWMPLSRVAFMAGIMGAGMLQSQMLIVHRKALQNTFRLDQLEEGLNDVSAAISMSRDTTSNASQNVRRHHHHHQRHKRNDTTPRPTHPQHSLVAVKRRGKEDLATPTIASQGFSPSIYSSSLIMSSAASSPHAVHDELCGGCRYLPARRVQCAKLFEQLAKEQNTTIVKAARHALDVRKTAPENCRACLECEDHHRQYWRPDRAVPAIRKATTHYLTTIPKETYRIPRDILATEGYDVITRFFEQEPNRYPAKRYFFEYNPSIVPIPVNDYQPKLTIDGVVPAYVASYRVATQQSCFPANTTLQMIGGSWEERPPSISYLAIALLDKDLSLLVDVVVDLPKKFGIREDFRLFVLHNRLYLSSFSKLTPLHVGTARQPPYNNSNETQPVDNVFPSPLQLTIGSQHLFVSNDKDIQRKAKNLNFFVDSSTNQTLVELSPAGDLMSKPNAHQVQPVDLTLPSHHDNNPHQLYGMANVTSEMTASTRPSFYTVDELALAQYQHFYESPYVADRGSACCVEFERDGRTLLLGISHVKIPWGRRKMQDAGLTPNQYLSRFYAIEPTAPYRTVAMSGYICLSSFPTQSNDNPLAARSPHSSFTIGELTLDCPAIHFVTGMTEKVDDPSTLIIAYGVEDCTSWFVEVSKQQVVDLLFAPPNVQHAATEVQ